jgi:hypothetical protein
MLPNALNTNRKQICKELWLPVSLEKVTYQVCHHKLEMQTIDGTMIKIHVFLIDFCLRRYESSHTPLLCKSWKYIHPELHRDKHKAYNTATCICIYTSMVKNLYVMRNKLMKIYFIQAITKQNFVQYLIK